METSSVFGVPLTNSIPSPSAPQSKCANRSWSAWRPLATTADSSSLQRIMFNWIHRSRIFGPWFTPLLVKTGWHRGCIDWIYAAGRKIDHEPARVLEDHDLLVGRSFPRHRSNVFVGNQKIDCNAIRI